MVVTKPLHLKLIQRRSRSASAILILMKLAWFILCLEHSEENSARTARLKFSAFELYKLNTGDVDFVKRKMIALAM